MQKSHLTLRQLEIFLAVARLGSFRAAGLSLNLAPVVVGEHVKALELRLGGNLFARRPGSTPTLTDLGERILIRASAVMDAVAQLEDEAGREAQIAQWRICVSPYVSRHLTERILELQRRFAECQIIVQTVDKPVDQILDEVASGEFELAMTIGGMGDILGRQNLVGVRSVIDEPLALFAAQHHPLAARRNLTLEDFTPYPFAQLSREHPLRKVVDSALHKAGLKSDHCSIETDNYNAILANISQTTAIACLFAEANNSDAVTHRLRMLHLGFHLPAPQALLISSPFSQKDRRLQVAADFLANHYRFEASAARRELLAL